MVTCALAAVDPDGSGTARLSPDPATDPSWSPDGKRLAFINWKDQNAELYVWNVDGSTRRLTRTEARREISPAWSPDGTRIVFAGWGQEQHLFVINADGTGERQLTSDVRQGWRPDWSPDGRTIAFQVHRAIMLVDADGSNERSLAPGEAPAWSPDGTRIAFSRNGFYWAEGGLFTMAADGGDVRRITEALDDSEPDWSPDGSRMVFVRGSGGRFALYVANADGSGIRPIAGDSVRNLGPSWRP
jgi:TolB protein